VRDVHGETLDLGGALGSTLESLDEGVGLVAIDSGAVAAGARFANGRDFFGQPRGLFFIGCTEFWERISFHGMLALLVLYMVDQLLLPGHVENIVGFKGFRTAIEGVTGPLTSQALASQIFGLYVGFVYLMPVFGGLLGDRVLGRRRAVALGALLMTAGHFAWRSRRHF
jgi:POT family proton-dependent oligopeptide transporter